MPLLTIVTRTCKRPALLARLRESIAAQTSQDLEHYIIEDEVGRGVGWSHREIARRAPEFRGRYVQVIDDDDWITDPGYLADLADIVADYAPDVVVVRMSQPGLILPTRMVWQKDEPICGHIAGECAVVERELFLRHADAWSTRYEGDFDFLASVWTEKPRVYWHGRVVLTTDQRRKGRPGE